MVLAGPNGRALPAQIVATELLLQAHAVGVIGHRGRPIAEDAQNTYIPIQDVQYFHHVPLAPYGRIESLVIKAVITVGE